MKIVVLIVVLPFLISCSNSEKEEVKVEPQSKPISYVINQSDSTGIFNSNLIKSELIKIFGKGNIDDQSEWLDEGTVEVIVTQLYPESKDEAILTWKENGSLDGIRISRSNSQWSVNGLKIGMSQAELSKANTTDFEFYGFGWDNGGFIYDWNNGALSESKNNVSVYLNMDFENLGNQNIDKFMGDNVQLSSNNKDLQKLKVFISSIELKF
ncbi:MAG: hypothetical protein PF445_01745 [Melioribacteraceae bacterium]|jgi:hypothetical protein|nr:hypothetical protein [Melioribacteraceae bacterium]